MQAADVLLSRRSLRAFDSTKKVPQQVIEKLIQAAVNAPTAVNQQHFRVYVETDRKVLDIVSKMTIERVHLGDDFRAKIGGFTGDDLVFYDAPAVVFLFTPPSSVQAKIESTIQIDFGFVAQNVVCVATLLGLASVPVGMVGVLGYDLTKVLLGNAAQEGCLPVLAIPVGHALPSATPAPLGNKLATSELLLKRS